MTARTRSGIVVYVMNLIPLSEAAKSLGIVPSTLRHQLRLKRFQAHKVGRTWYVTPEEVARYRVEVQGKDKVA